MNKNTSAISTAPPLRGRAGGEAFNFQFNYGNYLQSLQVQKPQEPRRGFLQGNLSEEW